MFPLRLGSEEHISRRHINRTIYSAQAIGSTCHLFFSGCTLLPPGLMGYWARSYNEIGSESVASLRTTLSFINDIRIIQ